MGVHGGGPYGEDGILTATVWLEGAEEVQTIGNSIELAGLKCKVSQDYLNECAVCGGRGHWEEKCAVVKMSERKRVMIAEEVEKIEGNRLTW